MHRDAYDLIDWYGLLEKVETCWDVCTVSWARWNWPAAVVDAGASNPEVPENYLNNGHFQGQAQADPGLDSPLSKTGGEEASLMLSARSGPGQLEEVDTVRSARVVLSVESLQKSGMGGLRTTRRECVSCGGAESSHGRGDVLRCLNKGSEWTLHFQVRILCN